MFLSFSSFAQLCLVVMQKELFNRRFFWLKFYFLKPLCLDFSENIERPQSPSSIGQMANGTVLRKLTLVRLPSPKKIPHVRSAMAKTVLAIFDCTMRSGVVQWTRIVMDPFANGVVTYNTLFLCFYKNCKRFCSETTPVSSRSSLTAAEVGSSPSSIPP
ncbi:hypothetical protein L2E82_02691 [Cichorium intybus]|uniref:Uncharacterized protein n=1 Tax=Cichorium intybus TaxID=13427 RepID=A0ACB9H3K0_CICIN|nr:hypothetical protein L2E82_02691 [Cichorium intybus]